MLHLSDALNADQQGIYLLVSHTSEQKKIGGGGEWIPAAIVQNPIRYNQNLKEEEETRGILGDFAIS